MNHYQTLSEAWAAELRDVRITGNESCPRGMATVEKRWSQFAVQSPLTFPVAAEGRKFRDVIGVLEGLSLVGQFSVPELFTDRVKSFARFTDGGVFHGSYGARIAGSLIDLVELLKRDPDSRQAVLTVFDSTRDLNRVKTDIPCTISIQFMLRASPYKGSSLDMRVTMRSNDLWLGTPYDFTQFAILQASVAQALSVKPGLYVHAAGSLHLYERDFALASRIGEPLGYEEQAFPLWECASDIGEISKRARDICLGAKAPVTEFERWAYELLEP